MTVCKWLFKMSEYQNNRVSNLHISIYVYRIVHLENTNDQLHRKNIEPLCFPPRNYIYCDSTSQHGDFYFCKTVYVTTFRCLFLKCSGYNLGLLTQVRKQQVLLFLLNEIHVHFKIFFTLKFNIFSRNFQVKNIKNWTCITNCFRGCGGHLTMMYKQEHITPIDKQVKFLYIDFMAVCLGF